MANVGTAELEITNSGAGAAVGALQSVGGALTSLGKVALAVGAAGLTALGAAFGVAISEAMEAQRVMAQTNAVIASTKGVAGVSAEAVADLAQSLQNMSGVAAEAIQAGQNILLTFTNIGSNVFPAATQTMLDMSVALGQDLKSSAIQLGKALQDPIAGITALRRVGVNFTDAQQRMIGKLVESGNLLAAQKLILQELQTEFGGSAEAIGKTFGGQLEIAKLRLLDIAEAVGMKLLPSLSKLVENGLPIVERFANLAADALLGLGTTFDNMSPVVDDFIKSLDLMVFHVQAGWSPLTILGQLLPDVFTPEVRKSVDKMAESIANFGAKISPDLESALDGLGGALKDAWDENAPTVIDNLSSAIDGLGTAIDDSNIIGLLGNIGEVAISAAGGLAVFGSSVLLAAAQLANGDFSGALTTLQGGINGFADSISQAVGGMNMNEVGTIWYNNLNTLSTIMFTWLNNTANDIMTGVPQMGTGIIIGMNILGAQIGAAAGSLALNVTTQVGAWAAAGASLAGALIGGAVMSMLSLPGTVVSSITQAITQATTEAAKGDGVGAALGSGIASGIAGKVGNIIGAAVSAVEAAIDAAWAAADAQSPSKIMMKLGGFMSEGMARGITRNADMAVSAMSGVTSAAMQPAYAMARGSGSTIYNQTTRGGDMHIGSMTIQATDDDNLTALLAQAQQGRAAV